MPSNSPRVRPLQVTEPRGDSPPVYSWKLPWLPAMASTWSALNMIHVPGSTKMPVPGPSKVPVPGPSKIPAPGPSKIESAKNAKFRSAGVPVQYAVPTESDMIASALSAEGSSPPFVEVVIEVPRGDFVKRRPDGSIDLFGPLPCPFNYGSVPSVIAADGDPLDAIVLGPRLPYGHRGTWRVRGMVRFTDAGLVDNKLVCTQPRVRPGTGRPASVPGSKAGRGGPTSAPGLSDQSWKIGGHFSTVGTTTTTSSSSIAAGQGQSLEKSSNDATVGGDLEESKDLSLVDWMLITSFFKVYTNVKVLVNAARRKKGKTSFDGWVLF